MKNDIDYIIEQKAFKVQFTFQHRENQLIIHGDSQRIQYTGSLDANPFITFDKIQKFLLASNYEIVLKSDELLKISIGGLVDLSLKGKQKITLESLKDIVEKLNAKVQTQINKNNRLSVNLMQVICTTKSLKEQLDRERNKNFKLEAYLSSQRSSFNQLMERFANNESQSSKTLTKQLSEIQKLSSQNDIKQITQTQSNKICHLENQFNQFKSFIQQNIQNIDSLNSQVTQLKTQFDNHISQNAKSLTEENQFMKQSQVVCTLQEKSTIKRAKLLYRASENDFCTMKFHKKCDGVADSLTVIWTEFDKKIGCFTPLKWKSPKYFELVADNSKESFIFSLTHKDKFTLKEPQNAIQNNKNYGPIFGDGYDLFVCDKANSSDKSSANICFSYHNEKYKQYDQLSLERFHGGSEGSQEFKIKQWEVWGVEWA